MKKYSIHENEFSARKITVICDRALDRLPYAQAGVNVNGKSVILVSYNTVAADIEKGFLTVSCLCSNTTRRHVSAFLKEYAPRLSYYDAKRAFLAGKPINIETGELAA